MLPSAAGVTTVFPSVTSTHKYYKHNTLTQNVLECSKSFATTESNFIQPRIANRIMCSAMRSVQVYHRFQFPHIHCSSSNSTNTQIHILHIHIFCSFLYHFVSPKLYYFFWLFIMHCRNTAEKIIKQPSTVTRRMQLTLLGKLLYSYNPFYITSNNIDKCNMSVLFTTA